jgi:hypothetical protein
MLNTKSEINGTQAMDSYWIDTSINNHTDGTAIQNIQLHYRSVEEDPWLVRSYVQVWKHVMRVHNYNCYRTDR